MKIKIISIVLILMLSLFVTSCDLLDPGGYGKVEEQLGTVITASVKDAVYFIIDVETVTEKYVEGYLAVNPGEELSKDGKTFVLSETPDSEGTFTVVTMHDSDIDPDDTHSKVYFKVGDSIWIENGVFFNVGELSNEVPSNWHPITISEYLNLVEKVESTKLKVSGYYDRYAKCLTAKPGGAAPRKISIGIDLPEDNEIPNDSYITVIGNLQYCSKSLHNCEFVEGDE